jgi:hypothetical protein
MTKHADPGVLPSWHRPEFPNHQDGSSLRYIRPSWPGPTVPNHRERVIRSLRDGCRRSVRVKTRTVTLNSSPVCLSFPGSAQH